MVGLRITVLEKYIAETMCIHMLAYGLCMLIYICVCIDSLSLHNIVYIYIYIYNSIHAYLVFSYMSDTGLIGAWILALVFFAMVVPMESN